MTDASRPSPAGAGRTLVATTPLCGAAGPGAGAQLGLAVPLGIAGPFAAIVAGFALVHSRFRDI